MRKLRGIEKRAPEGGGGGRRPPLRLAGLAGTDDLRADEEGRVEVLVAHRVVQGEMAVACRSKR